MRILDRLPILERGWMAPTPDGAEIVKPYQIIVLISITAKDIHDLPHDAPRFPAVLDTGHNHNFAIRQEHLHRWVHLTLPRSGQIEVAGSFVPLFTAELWIHPNQGGSVEPSGGSPFRLVVKEGLAVYPAITANPARLPTLGLRAIIRNGLKLTIDGTPRELTLDSPTP